MSKPNSPGAAALALGSLGVVYGDIGTSPLYALRVALGHVSGDGITRLEVLGVVSLLLWTLLLIVTVKYLLFLLRADNQGEGGILSLFALVQREACRGLSVVLALGIAGAALFFGDAVITPAISVLSAVEGLSLVTPVFQSMTVPIAAAILVALFAVQHRGTGVVGAWFGPVMLIWFAVIGTAGAIWTLREPGVFAAFNPLYGIDFLIQHGLPGTVVLGGVFLAVTGAEAMYADLGHFGRRPIQIAWFAVVLPGLVFSYLGQGALVLTDPKALANPFFHLVPFWALLPLVLLATLATIIASQAVITGAFSMVRQAIHLRLLPQLRLSHTSATQRGQVYMPAVNWLLLVSVLTLTIGFASSDNLAAAYGIAVSGTMVITTALVFCLLRWQWGWAAGWAFCATVPFLLIELAFFTVNLAKLPDGGYVPVLITLVLAIVMWTWQRGSRLIADFDPSDAIRLGELIGRLDVVDARLLPGTGIYLAPQPAIVPPALLHNLNFRRQLNEQNFVVHVVTRRRPRIPRERGINIEQMGKQFARIEMQFGFMDAHDIWTELIRCRDQLKGFDPGRATFFIQRRQLKPAAILKLPLWQRQLFVGLSRIAIRRAEYYRIPPERIEEIIPDENW